MNNDNTLIPRSNYERVVRLEGAASATAKALLRRNDIKVLATGYVAKYNFRTKTLSVPEFSLSSDADPRLVNAWRGTLDHECAHVMHTDGDLLVEQQAVWMRDEGDKATVMLHTLMNVYEDIRIEKLWAENHIGSRRYLTDMHGYVSDKTGRGAPTDPAYMTASGQPLGVFGALVQGIVRVRMDYIEEGEVHPIIAGLMAHLDAEIEKGSAAETFQEVLDAAKATYEKLKELSDPPDDNSPKGKGGEEGSEEEDTDQEPGDGEDSGDEEGDEEEEDGEGSDDGDDEADSDEDGESAGDDDDEEPGTVSDEGGQSNGGSPNQSGHGHVKADDIKDLAANAVHGEWGVLASDAEIIAGEYLQDPENRVYTVHPDAAVQDIWETFDAEQRREGAKVLRHLKASAGLAVSVLSSHLRDVIKATKQTLFVGGLEDGEFLDQDALADVALGFSTEAIYADFFDQTDESVYVTVLVDDSGSMGDNQPHSFCSVAGHGNGESKSGKCQKRDYGGKRCGKELKWKVDSKSGYAAIMAMALHEALRLCGVEHAILGHHNAGGYWYRAEGELGRFKAPEIPSEERTIVLPNGQGYPRWSRHSTRLVMSEYVPAPGIHDDGSALPFITGRGANLDGEAVLEAAKYLAKHARDKDRCILFVIADGHPAGADDSMLEDLHLQRTVEKVAEAGIEVYGIGVGVSKSRFEKFYPTRASNPSRAATGLVIVPSDGSGIGRAVLNELIGILAQSLGYSRRRAS